MPLQISEHAPPFFSIVLTTYERAHLLKQAIQSVIEQTMDDWELLVIDDGSTDETRDLVHDFGQRDPRIRYHFSANRRTAYARNVGCQMSVGRYITFLDSDDTYLPDHLALRAAFLRQHTDVDLLHGGVEIAGPAEVPDRFDTSRMIPLSECTIGGTFVIRRELVFALGGFRSVYGDDSDFFARAEASGATIARIDAPTYRYNRLEQDSICAKTSAITGDTKREETL